MSASQKPRSEQRSLRWAWAEASAIVLVLLATVVELGHLSSDGWRSLLLFDRDSLTLSVLGHTFVDGGPFQWIASPQFMVFPELPLYALSFLVTGDLATALVVQAILTVLVLYGLFRFVLGAFTDTSRWLRMSFAVVLVLVMLGLMLLEQRGGGAEGGAITFLTPILLNSYYGGVVLSGLYVIGAALRVLTASAAGRTVITGKGLGPSSVWMAVILPLVVSVLTTFSNPMFAVQVVAPWGIALAIGVVARRLEWRPAAWALLPGLVGALLGLAARIPAAKFIGLSESTQFKLDELELAWNRVTSEIGLAFTTIPGALALIVIIGAIVLAWVTGVSGRRLEPLRTLALFAGIQAVWVFVFFLLAGKTEFRYYLPLAFFPLLALLPWASMVESAVRRSGRTKAIALSTAAAVTCAVVVGAIVSAPRALSVAKDATPQATNCLDEVISPSERGVAQYWSARTLDLYGSGYEILPVWPNFVVYPWQDDLADYEGGGFTFVIVGSAEPERDRGITLEDVSTLGEPSQVINCGSVSVYRFAPGTEGYNTLNDRINQSWLNLEQLRTEGRQSEYFS